MKNPKTVFRYPGGKAKLAGNIVSKIDELIPRLKLKSESYPIDPLWGKRLFYFVDVFAGGGSVTMAFLGNHSARTYLNELDKNMIAFWSCFKTVEDENELVNLIKSTKPTVENFKLWQDGLQANDFKSPWEMGFAALFINRTAFSGILSSGPIGGYEQKGKYKIGCRYNQKKLVETIRTMGGLLRANNYSVTNWDFRDTIREFSGTTNAILYLDPPYMEQGSQLYRHWMVEKDYEDMRDLLKAAKCQWVLSHDMNKKFLTMYEDWANIETIEGVPYTINSIKNKKRIELLITPK